MNDKPIDVSEQVLESYSFMENDPKWGGAVERVQRELTFPNGAEKTFVDVRIRVGTRWLILPRGGLDGIIEALQQLRATQPVRTYTPEPSRTPDPNFRSAQRRRTFEPGNRKQQRHDVEEFEE